MVIHNFHKKHSPCCPNMYKISMSKEYDSLSEYSIEENSSLTIPGGHQHPRWSGQPLDILPMGPLELKSCQNQ